MLPQPRLGAGAGLGELPYDVLPPIGEEAAALGPPAALVATHAAKQEERRHYLVM